MERVSLSFSTYIYIYILYREDDILLLFAEERVSRFSIERRETLSLCSGGCVSLLDREDDILLLLAEESVSLLYREDDILLLSDKETISFLYREERDSFSLQRRVCLSSL